MELLVLYCLLGGGLGLALPPIELSLTIRLQDVARNIPSRCVEHSVTPVSCADVHNSDALVAHPDDCQLFYYCEESRSSPTCRQCPAGLHFNPKLHVCDWPQNAGCTAQAPPTTGTAAPTTDSPHNTTKPTLNTTTSSVTHQNTTQPSNVTWSGVTPTIPSNTNTTATGSNDTTTTAPPPLVSSTDSWPPNETWPNPGSWNHSNSSSNINTTATESIGTSTAPPPMVNSTDSWPSNETWAWATTTVPSNLTDAPASNNTAWESLNGNRTDDRPGNITEPPDTQNKSSDYSDNTTPVSPVPTRTDRQVTDSTTSSSTSHQASSTRRSHTTSRPRNSIITSRTSAPTTTSFRHTTLGWRLLN